MPHSPSIIIINIINDMQMLVERKGSSILQGIQWLELHRSIACQL